MNKKIVILCVFSAILTFSCNSSEEKSNEKNETKDSVKTDEAELPAVEEVEMDFMYEVTYTKTKKVVMMSQEEYLESGIWENPDVVIKEVPVVK